MSTPPGVLQTALILTAGCLVALALALYGEWRERWGLVRLTKPLASAAFLAIALLGPIYGDAFRMGVFVALVFSFFGDVFLMWKARPLFLCGLLAFLFGHIGFAAAFVLGGVSVPYFVGGLVAMGVVAFAVGRWILKHVDDALRAPVIAYITIISLMVALAIGHYGIHGALVVPAAALAFYGSDISVARDRFLGAGMGNRLWGLPLYYTAQLAFAWHLALASVEGLQAAG